jgi:hypothetical protein
MFAINSVMKPTPITLHKQHIVLVDDMPNMYLSHHYQRTIKAWTFTGYRCSACGQSLKHMGNILKHNDLCKVLNKKSKASEPL